MKVKTQRERRMRRHLRLRKKIEGTPERPRLCVYRSLQHMHAQVIDDIKGHTLASASSMEEGVKSQLDGSSTGSAVAATAVGKLIAARAKEKGITQIAFDRNGNLYHGRVKALADAAREAGLEF
jgi:large subunit ribosomal protein L18